jgi:hypothetical protein
MTGPNLAHVVVNLAKHMLDALLRKCANCYDCYIPSIYVSEYAAVEIA